MKLWLISQDINRGYDTYDSMVVAATTEDHARSTRPAIDGCPVSDSYVNNTWASPERVGVVYLGAAKRGTKPGVICASFNAG